MFEHYGVPPYIAGFSVSAIAWKTDRWNIRGWTTRSSCRG